jgi:hypothetical protein
VYHSDDEAARWRLSDLERDHDRLLAEWDLLARQLYWSERRCRRQHGSAASVRAVAIMTASPDARRDAAARWLDRR